MPTKYFFKTPFGAQIFYFFFTHGPRRWNRRSSDGLFFLLLFFHTSNLGHCKDDLSMWRRRNTSYSYSSSSSSSSSSTFSPPGGELIFLIFIFYFFYFFGGGGYCTVDRGSCAVYALFCYPPFYPGWWCEEGEGEEGEEKSICWPTVPPLGTVGKKKTLVHIRGGGGQGGVMCHVH